MRFIDAQSTEPDTPNSSTSQEQREILGSVQAPIESGPGEMNIRLETHAPISGRVVDRDGIPLEQFVVVARPVDPVTGHPDLHAPIVAAARSGDDGLFRLTGTSKEVYELSADDERAHPRISSGRAVGGSLEVLVQFERTATRTIRLMRRGAEPVRGVSVRAVRGLAVKSRGVTDENGMAQLKGLDPRESCELQVGVADWEDVGRAPDHPPIVARARTDWMPRDETMEFVEVEFVIDPTIAKGEGVALWQRAESTSGFGAHSQKFTVDNHGRRVLRVEQGILIYAMPSGRHFSLLNSEPPGTLVPTDMDRTGILVR